MPDTPALPGLSRAVALFAGARLIAPLVTSFVVSIAIAVFGYLLPSDVGGVDTSRMILSGMLMAGGTIGGVALYLGARGLEEAATGLDVGGREERMAAPLVAVVVLAVRPLLSIAMWFVPNAMLGLFAGLLGLLPPVILLARLGRVFGALGDTPSRVIAYGFAAAIALPYAGTAALAIASEVGDGLPTGFEDPRVWGTVAFEGMSTAAEMALVLWLAWVAATRR